MTRISRNSFQPWVIYIFTFHWFTYCNLVSVRVKRRIKNYFGLFILSDKNLSRYSFETLDYYTFRKDSGVHLYDPDLSGNTLSCPTLWKVVFSHSVNFFLTQSFPFTQGKLSGLSLCSQVKDDTGTSTVSTQATVQPKLPSSLLC